MRTRFSRVLTALLLVVTGWLCFPAGNAQAHPLLVGDWVSPTPPGATATFHFCPGEHLGNGLWRGQCSLNVSNCSVIYGPYELNMIDDHQATLTPLRSHTNGSPTVGLVDFSTGVLTVKNVTYRRRGPIIGVPVLGR